MPSTATLAGGTSTTASNTAAIERLQLPVAAACGSLLTRNSSVVD
jgi:hypothetical protein